MATEDARYRQSSQFRLWSFSPSSLQELRRKTNSLARQQIAPRLPADPPPEPLNVDEELQLVKFYTVELLRAAEFCKIPTDSRSTAAIFLRRFYVTNSIMTYPPTELLKTCLFFGCKADGVYYPLGQLAKMFPNTTSEQILAGEYLLCQGLRFAFDVRHPLRPLEGAILELRKRFPDEERRIQKAHARTREILKFSSLMTDAYFHFSPSQIMMAALLMVDEELVDRLLPPVSPGDASADPARATGLHSSLRDKIMLTIKSCRTMLEEERPERMKEFWGPENVKHLKPLRRRLKQSRDPDRADLVALQRARRDYAAKQDKKKADGTEDGAVFGDNDSRDAKRRKVEKQDDVFGPPL
ncbi:hypothetical protein NLU13_7963 [Sarocladium strictum]|uniref:Cyclin C-terminal domain-containing protein n=1 Tax=Sarocladium strictum TaxID=5046 RepID=A0AA39GB39_SARSR|nr:hypothetical protein NLU13_7963 [Sarocladium strictum]